MRLRFQGTETPFYYKPASTIGWTSDTMELPKSWQPLSLQMTLSYVAIFVPVVLTDWIRHCEEGTDLASSISFSIHSYTKRRRHEKKRIFSVWLLEKIKCMPSFFPDIKNRFRKLKCSATSTAGWRSAWIWTVPARSRQAAMLCGIVSFSGEEKVEGHAK